MPYVHSCNMRTPPNLANAHPVPPYRETGMAMIHICCMQRGWYFCLTQAPLIGSSHLPSSPFSIPQSQSLSFDTSPKPSHHDQSVQSRKFPCSLATIMQM
ncbi:hypothetical protein FALCPG4_001174 [Fusarium falciforme]